MRFLSRLLVFLSFTFYSSLVWAENAVQPGVGPVDTGTGRDAMMANSPFTAYTAGVVADVLIVGVLVLALLVGGFLVVNLSMMSRRKQDLAPRSREPSDVGILKEEMWPRQRVNEPVLPAELPEDQITAIGPEPIPEPELDQATLLHEEDMPPDYQPGYKIGRKPKRVA